MIIDFNEITHEILLNFKGGEGELHTRNFIDDKCKIMMSSLAPGFGIPGHCRETRTRWTWKAIRNRPQWARANTMGH